VAGGGKRYAEWGTAEWGGSRHGTLKIKKGVEVRGPETVSTCGRNPRSFNKRVIPCIV